MKLDVARELISELQNDLDVSRIKARRSRERLETERADEEQSAFEEKTWSATKDALVYLIQKRREQGVSPERIGAEVENRFRLSADAHPTQHPWRPEDFRMKRRYDLGQIDELFWLAKSQEKKS